MAAEIDGERLGTAIAAYAQFKEHSNAVLVTHWTMVVEIVDTAGEKRLRHWTSEDTPTWLVRGMMDSASDTLEYDWEEEEGDA